MHSLRKLDEVALSLHQFEDDKGGVSELVSKGANFYM